MNEESSTLKTSLLDLLHELRDSDVPLILGGGYGLYLKQMCLSDKSDTTFLISMEHWASARATEDLDIILTTEVLANPDCTEIFRRALDSLGYTPVPGSEYWQFVKRLSHGRCVKIDLLTGPLAGEATKKLRSDKRRVGLRGTKRILHARRMDEALGFGDNFMMISLEGKLTSGEVYSDSIYIPSSFTLLLMKLHAFRDRYDDERKELGRHHALDIYRILVMMDESEYQDTLHQIYANKNEPSMKDAIDIVKKFFASEESLGSLRLQEHPLWVKSMPLKEFLSTLNRMFQ